MQTFYIKKTKKNVKQPTINTLYFNFGMHILKYSFLPCDAQTYFTIIACEHIFIINIELSQKQMQCCLLVFYYLSLTDGGWKVIGTDTILASSFTSFHLTSGNLLDIKNHAVSDFFLMTLSQLCGLFKI